ncbi:hypothetical protein CSHISOI_08575 [Colletotrichum shisoi]|uniref:Killer toxin Kp4 domain-containing protein n=1 Tax=Colletotrichum shisoi TaxID=2078593 RepID=A0A5Q4BJQ7_9PEZI|nr:hypothetical protein CSHISOI_08575 [Colletotrichum shisoi]
MQFSLAAALILLAVASTAATKGINCEGSSNCNPSFNSGVWRTEAGDVKNLIDRIPVRQVVQKRPEDRSPASDGSGLSSRVILLKPRDGLFRAT